MNSFPHFGSLTPNVAQMMTMCHNGPPHGIPSPKYNMSALQPMLSPVFSPNSLKQQSLLSPTPGQCYPVAFDYSPSRIIATATQQINQQRLECSMRERTMQNLLPLFGHDLCSVDVRKPFDINNCLPESHRHAHPLPQIPPHSIYHPRRKNASRESTNTLKSWLSEHKKNPYPTKGEKIMLAIITKMTLTQVSTWFANARRRLKKENKATWQRSDSEDLQDLDDADLLSNNEDDSDNEDDDVIQHQNCDTKTPEQPDDRNVSHASPPDRSASATDKSDKSESDKNPETCAKIPISRPSSSPIDSEVEVSALRKRVAVDLDSENLTLENVNKKPKIWSIADFALM